MEKNKKLNNIGTSTQIKFLHFKKMHGVTDVRKDGQNYPTGSLYAIICEKCSNYLSFKNICPSVILLSSVLVFVLAIRLLSFCEPFQLSLNQINIFIKKRQIQYPEDDVNKWIDTAILKVASLLCTYLANLTWFIYEYKHNYAVYSK